MLIVKTLLAKILGSIKADYIIEQGTSGIWTYRKWASGIAECWGLWYGTLSHYGSALGGYAYNSGAISYPSGLFIAKPNAQFSGYIGSGFCLCGNILSNSSKDNIVCYAIATASGSQSCGFYIHSVGRWKSGGVVRLLKLFTPQRGWAVC